VILIRISRDINSPTPACAALSRFVCLSRQLFERLLKDFGGLAAADQMPIIVDH
jgi:hypothetical protein